MTVKRIFHFQFGTDGGTEQFFLRLTKAFNERGIEQQFAIRPGTTWSDELARIGKVHQGYYLRRWPNWWLRNQWLKRSIDKWQPDAIMGWRAPTGRLMPARSSAARIVRLGDYPHHLRHFDNIDCIVGNAPNVLAHCQALGWTGKTRIISNFPIETVSEPVRRAEHNTPDDVPLVCSVGRFFPTKGFDTLIHAVARVPGLWLWLVGDGQERAELERLVDKLGIAERTRFIGWVSDPIAWIRAADIFCVPSREEPLGNVLLEGWRAGVPVVSTKSEGPSWASTDSENALMVEIDDPAEMAAAMARILASPDLGQKLAEGGRRRLEERFSRKSIVDRYLKLFDELKASR